jgi:hypothetical protein
VELGQGWARAAFHVFFGEKKLQEVKKNMFGGRFWPLKMRKNSDREPLLLKNSSEKKGRNTKSRTSGVWGKPQRKLVSRALT